MAHEFVLKLPVHSVSVFVWTVIGEYKADIGISFEPKI